MPQTQDEWKTISDKFFQQWNFPYCLGAIDGKHISFVASHSSGSYYYNYKGYHSIVLLALCDADYKFSYIDVGVNGRNSDGAVFRESTLKRALDMNILQFPENSHLPGQQVKVPYVFVADEAFPLSERILKPYSSRGLSVERRIFNYRLSRARRVVENAFGILANRWRILLTNINLSPEKVQNIVLACCVLHNFLIMKKPKQYIDIEKTCKLGDLNNLQGPNRCAQNALNIRDAFARYFSHEGAVPWQNEHCFL